jgi:hypothetical protein
MSLTPRIDKFEDPTQLTDAEATIQGKKQYLHDGTYNGGNAPTVTPASGSVEGKAVFIPYQTQDGSWRMKFNLAIASTSNVSLFTFTVDGITSATPPYSWQSISGGSLASTSAARTYSRIGQNSNTFEIQLTGPTTAWIFHGDIALDSKPTWAY